MVTQYGMSDKFGLMGLASQEDQYLSGRVVMNCGDATAAEVDDEVMKMLKEAYEEAKQLLTENRDVMDKIAEFLIERETITGKEFMKIFREMKGIPEPDENLAGQEKGGRIVENTVKEPSVPSSNQSSPKPWENSWVPPEERQVNDQQIAEEWRKLDKTKEKDVPADMGMGEVKK